MTEEDDPDQPGSCQPYITQHSCRLAMSAIDRVTFQTLHRVWKNERFGHHLWRDGVSDEVVEYGPSTHVNSLVSTHPSTPQRCAEAERASLTFHLTVHTLTVYVAFGAARPAHPVGWLSGPFRSPPPPCSPFY